MFTFVPKKFLHLFLVNENKGATKSSSLRRNKMAKDITSVLRRSSNTIIADAIGISSLMVMLFGALALPGFY